MLSRKEKTIGGGFLAFWVLMVLGNLAFWAVIVWAIIKLVNHYA